MSEHEIRARVKRCCTRLRRVADVAELAADGPELGQAVAHLSDLLGEVGPEVSRLGEVAPAE